MPDTLASIRDVLSTEAAALTRLVEDAGTQAEALSRACDLIRTACGTHDGQTRPGRLVVTGVGKAGHIGNKLAATFASTGTPSFFLHPTEARHGDLGMVQSSDVILALSNSGSSEEVVSILPNLKHIGCPLIALVGKTDSPLARHADIVLTIGKVAEACPLGLAPSTSTTALLALGDAVALTVQRQRRLTPEQYARFHPGGALGRKLMTCREAMRSGERVPTVPRTTSVLDCMRAISAARAGSVLITTADGVLEGIFTDGDLRRVLTKAADPARVLADAVGTYATIPCRAVRADELLHAALHLCSEKKINELPVVDDQRRVVGLLDLQDLVDRGFEV